ncbi:hypothetical protein [Idiomarina ramblicola]|uniref:Uncharacterized protein n=1 Tax=Idiomarina ramblicola TaxID=263724 RepID=A0A432YSX4_9GAMM|nr:hypothetical protein [Idiomarina ramblicola]RUO64676.1 hypothetical protein CWI78_12290 [Idiomarina ramblicola]
MVKPIQKVLWCWGASVLVFTVVAIAVSYFLTGYQANQLKNTLQSQNRQLQQPAPQIPEAHDTTLPEPPAVDVASLLTQAAKQQQVDLHYQQSPEHSEQWLVGISGTYQNAIRFIASILQTQQESLQAFPFTQTLKWQDGESHRGELSWQFLWLTAKDSAPPDVNGKPLFKTDFPPMLAEPLKCLGKPGILSDIRITDWASVQLLATQTSPLKKALLSIPGQPLLTLTEHDWIASPLMQLQNIKRDHIAFQHWQKEAGCWSAQSRKLFLTKDTNQQ